MSITNKPRVRRNSSEMYPLVSSWLSSEESQQDFCHRHGLTVGTFAYWVGKYRREDEDDQKIAAPSFVPLLASGNENLSDVGQIRLIYGEVSLEFASGVGADFIVSLFQKLGG